MTARKADRPEKKEASSNVPGEAEYWIDGGQVGKTLAGWGTNENAHWTPEVFHKAEEKFKNKFDGACGLSSRQLVSMKEFGVHFTTLAGEDVKQVADSSPRDPNFEGAAGGARSARSCRKEQSTPRSLMKSVNSPWKHDCDVYEDHEDSFGLFDGCSGLSTKQAHKRYKNRSLYNLPAHESTMDQILSGRATHKHTTTRDGLEFFDGAAGCPHWEKADGRRRKHYPENIQKLAHSTDQIGYFHTKDELLAKRMGNLHQSVIGSIVFDSPPQPPNEKDLALSKMFEGAIGMKTAHPEFFSKGIRIDTRGRESRRVAALINPNKMGDMDPNDSSFSHLPPKSKHQSFNGCLYDGEQVALLTSRTDYSERTATSNYDKERTKGPKYEDFGYFGVSTETRLRKERQHEEVQSKERAHRSGFHTACIIEGERTIRRRSESAKLIERWEGEQYEGAAGKRTQLGQDDTAWPFKTVHRTSQNITVRTMTDGSF